MIELYHNDMSVCAQKVRLALAELQLSWTSHHLKLRSDEQLRPDYLKLNPKGQVPTLVHDDVIVTESTVINEYLVEVSPGSPLVPASAADRARMRLWTRQLDDDVHKATGTFSVSIAFRQQYLKNEPYQLEHILVSIPEEARRAMKRQAFATALDNPELPAAARRMNKLLGDMDATLVDSEWLLGEAFTLADVGMIPYVLRMQHLNMSVMFDRRPQLAAWFDRVKARPSYRLAIEEWLNSAYLELMAEAGRAAQPRIAQMLGPT